MYHDVSLEHRSDHTPVTVTPLRVMCPSTDHLFRFGLAKQGRSMEATMSCCHWVPVAVEVSESTKQQVNGTGSVELFQADLDLTKGDDVWVVAGEEPSKCSLFH